ncbi:MAG: 50S ribosomal protein L10 [Myxococcota bacterium]|nr:50S ribosomal protein L10 [Myxococcota bacterium]
MLKSEKEELIKELNDKFTRAKSVVLAEFNKVNVDTVTRLRKKLRDSGIDYKVLKNTLAKRAAKGTSVEVLSEDFTGPVAIAVSYGDVIAPAKIISEFIKDMETIKIRSGVVDGKRIDKAGVQTLAKLPGLPELRATLLGMLNQPAGKLVRTIAAPGSQLARVLQARNDAQGSNAS